MQNENLQQSNNTNNIQQMQNINQDGSQEQREQSLFSTVAGGVGNFMAMSYMYMQLDNVFDGLTNSHIKDYTMGINLPFSDFYSTKASAHTMNIGKGIDFSSNMALTPSGKASYGNIARTLYRGDNQLLTYLKENGFSDDIIEKMKKGKFGMRSAGMNSITKVDNIAHAEAGTGFSNTIKKIFGKTVTATNDKTLEGNIVKNIRKTFKGVSDEQAQGLVNFLRENTTNVQHASSKVRTGVGVMINTNKALPYIFKTLPFRALATVASIWFHPLNMMIVKPLIETMHSIIKSPTDKKVEAYKTQEDEYSFSSTEQEFMASENMNMQNLIQTVQTNNFAMQGGRDVDKYMRMAFRKNGNVDTEPQRYRKRYR